jgi:hypothetical protein
MRYGSARAQHKRGSDEAFKSFLYDTQGPARAGSSDEAMAWCQKQRVFAAEARFSKTTKLTKSNQARGRGRGNQAGGNSPIEKGCLATPGIARSVAVNDQFRAVTKETAVPHESRAHRRTPRLVRVSYVESMSGWTGSCGHEMAARKKVPSARSKGRQVRKTVKPRAAKPADLHDCRSDALLPDGLRRLTQSRNLRRPEKYSKPLFG